MNTALHQFRCVKYLPIFFLRVIPKAKLLQLKPRSFIVMRNFLNKKVGNQKTKPIFIKSVLKVEY